MLSPQCLGELKSTWLPHTTDAGLVRLIDLLENGSPLLIHGSFSRAVPMGCLATHIAWNHPRTAHLTNDAGVTWLNRVARINPALSYVIRDWDQGCAQDWELRGELLAIFRAECEARRQPKQEPVEEAVLA